MQAGDLGWLGIVRLGLAQMALGAIVVITTSTLNRVMVVELALPAILPGALVALHHAMQLLRPRMGYGSDVGRRCTPWINGGMAVLATGGVVAAAGTALMKGSVLQGLLLSIVGFVLIGIGVSACGTSVLVLLAKRVPAERRGAAATVVWLMMIAGFAITSTVAGKQLDPYSPARLVMVTAAVSAVALAVTLLATFRVEPAQTVAAAAVASTVREPAAADKPAFWVALREVLAEPEARRFTVFIFVPMLAYSAQDLILEPFAGSHFHFTPGESTQLSGAQHRGIFVGMLLVALVTSQFRGRAVASLKAWVIGGAVASAAALAGLSTAALGGGGWPLSANVFLLGLANGAFSIAAIGAMMALASKGRGSREGVRMGLWGASQAIAFGGGGFVGTVLADLAKWLVGAVGSAYSFVFGLEALGFTVAAWLALHIAYGSTTRSTSPAAAVHSIPAHAGEGPLLSAAS